MAVVLVAAPPTPPRPSIDPEMLSTHEQQRHKLEDGSFLPARAASAAFSGLCQAVRAPDPDGRGGVRKLHARLRLCSTRGPPRDR